MGILYLTNAPKFVPAIPTPNAKNIENKIQNNKNGYENKMNAIIRIWSCETGGIICFQMRYGGNMYNIASACVC